MRGWHRLWARLRHAGRDQRGNAVVLYSLCLTVFMAFASIAVDVGQIYVSQQQLRVIADGAALAGARALPDATAANAAAQHVLDANRVAALGAASTISIAPDNSKVTVSLTRSVPTLFARVLGLAQSTVPGTAAAVSGPVGSMTGVVPLGVQAQPFTYGQQVVLKYSSDDNQLSAPGNYGALSLSDNGASAYLNDLEFGYGSPIHVGDTISTNPGNMRGPTRTGIQYRLDQAPDDTWDHYQPHSPRLVFLPVLDYSGANGRSPVHVLGFAAFFLEGIDDSGNVTGRFLRTVVESDLAPAGAADYGVRATKLSQ